MTRRGFLAALLAVPGAVVASLRQETSRNPARILRRVLGERSDVDAPSPCVSKPSADPVEAMKNEGGF
jgi:hypothetical protein